MNLALRGIDGSNIKWNPEGSFLNDAHQDLKADFVIANPPFNDSDWSGDSLRTDGRWQYGTPPEGNANFAWVQHFLYHLSPTGAAGFVLSNGSLSSNTSGEGEIRKALVEQDLVDCIVMLPTQLFYNTGIPACLWFLSRYKNRNRKGEVLFIDASELGYMVSRSSRAFTDDETSRIADTYHEWKKIPSPSPSQDARIFPSPSPSQDARIFPSPSPSQDAGIFPSQGQGGFIQEKNNVKTLVLSLQTPSAKADATRTNEFGAKSESPLKWTKRFFFRCMKPPWFSYLLEGVKLLS